MEGLGVIAGGKNHEVRDRFQNEFRQALFNGLAHLPTRFWIRRPTSKCLFPCLRAWPLRIAVPPTIRSTMEPGTKRAVP